MQKRFRVGDKVRLSDAGRENECYAKFRGRELKIQSVATRYMPASEFYKKGSPRGFHPGFDEGSGAALYDCAGISVSLYDWELEPA
jgi:hypothetical protein